MAFEEFDIEAVINFAIFALGDTSRFWIEGSLDQKQRFQRVLFPEGVTFDGERFGTPATCLAFSYLRESLAGKGKFGVPYESRTRVAAVKEKRITVIQENFATWIALYRT
jgi:hypothetical protein